MALRRRVRARSPRARLATLGLCAALGLAGCGAQTPSPTDPTASTSPDSSTPATRPGTTTPAETPASTAGRTPSRATTPLALPTVDPYAGQLLIDRVEWTEGADGARLLVFPTRAGRDTTFPGAEQRAWAEIRDRSPAAESPGMYDQFVCHWHWARLVQPDKPSWNLEPWRPDVGYEGTVAASCNPGGPER